MSADCPLARSDGLITEELDGELLVYDSESNMAHALDPEAAALWRACDGHSDAHALASRCHTSKEKIRDTLARLGELGLLNDTQADQDGDTRRVALRKIGIAGVGVATISSILVPAAAAAGSCVPVSFCAATAAQCCTGLAVAGFCEPPPLTQGNRCCLPAGACAVGLREGPGGCCSNHFINDSSCQFGIRCT